MSHAGESIRYFHPHHLGSMSVLTNSSGVKEEDVVCYPYREIFTNRGTASGAYKYTGKELDTSTGLLFYDARYYDANLGRFISADTLVTNPDNRQDSYRYTYGNYNPILLTIPQSISDSSPSIKCLTKQVEN